MSAATDYHCGRCGRCGLPVTDLVKLEIEGRPWHLDCYERIAKRLESRRAAAVRKGAFGV